MQLFKKQALLSIFLVLVPALAQSNILNIEYQIENKFDQSLTRISNPDWVRTLEITALPKPVIATARYIFDFDFDYESELFVPNTVSSTYALGNNTVYEFTRRLKVASYTTFSPFSDELRAGLPEKNSPNVTYSGLIADELEAATYTSYVVVNNDTDKIDYSLSYQGLRLHSGEKYGFSDDKTNIDGFSEYRFSSFLFMKTIFSDPIQNQLSSSDIQALLYNGGFEEARINEVVTHVRNDYIASSSWIDRTGYAGFGNYAFGTTSVNAPVNISLLIFSLCFLLFSINKKRAKE